MEALMDGAPPPFPHSLISPYSTDLRPRLLL